MQLSRFKTLGGVRFWKFPKIFFFSKPKLKKSYEQKSCVLPFYINILNFRTVESIIKSFGKEINKIPLTTHAKELNHAGQSMHTHGIFEIKTVNYTRAMQNAKTERICCKMLIVGVCWRGDFSYLEFSCKNFTWWFFHVLSVPRGDFSTWGILVYHVCLWGYYCTHFCLGMCNVKNSPVTFVFRGVRFSSFCCSNTRVLTLEMRLDYTVLSRC